MTCRRPYTKYVSFPKHFTWCATLAGLLLAGGSEVQGAPPLSKSRIFAAETGPLASIRRTTNGVPHIKADNLESAAFGSGYVQAQDNVCLLAEAFVKARSERTRYFGPGEDSFNIISDFSYKALGIHSTAVEEYPRLSDQSRALIEGFVAGYNKYVTETSPRDLGPECRDQPWVRPVAPADLYAYYRIVSQYASGDLFATGALFSAAPPGADPAPEVSLAASEAQPSDAPRLEQTAAAARTNAAQRVDYTDTGLASNAWGIGKTMTESGRGALLANPHFPYTGPRRMYQSHITVPGVVDVTGAGLIGMPIPLIGFNKNLGWSHTISTSRRFTVYELQLASNDDLSYVKDGKIKPIATKSVEIDGPGGATKLKKTFYYSEYGPMLAADAVTDGLLPSWGGNQRTAFTYRDANADASGILDTWLNMARSTDLKEFQSVFRSCGSTLWVNTIYADDQGNAYYVDSSSVPRLTGKTRKSIDAKLKDDPLYAGLFDAGLTLLDGSTSRNDWVKGRCGAREPFAKLPQLLRDDFVQNSNDSFWATNPAEFLTGFSPLYGPERVPQSPRTRLGLKMLMDATETGYAKVAPAGQDGRFGAKDLVDTIHNNRAWYAEQFLDELRRRCVDIGTAAVNLADGSSRTVSGGCSALSGWDGVFNTGSTGAHVFRVFMGSYGKGLKEELTVPFSPTDPVNTPRQPASAGDLSNDPMLRALATGLNKLDRAGIAYDAALGSVQFYQPSGGVPPGCLAGCNPPYEQGPRFPWHGGDSEVDGAFNAIGVAALNVAEDTRFPRISPDVIPDTAGLAAVSSQAGWRVARGTSWHFGLEFTDAGPRAFGLLSHSQSTDQTSPFFGDQSERYASKAYRPILFTEADIAANLLPGGEVVISAD